MPQLSGSSSQDCTDKLCAVTLPARPVIFALVLALVLGLLVWVVFRGGDAFSAARPLRLATWNMEWLVAPETARIARIACRDGQRAPLPCDVARSHARDSADLRAIAAEVRRLDADVIAFQEVENVAIARRVFRGYDICMTGGEGAQHAGFAFRPRRGIRCEPPLESVAAGRGRAGQPLLLHTGDGPPLHLLSVHLKSGCSRDALDSGTSACVLLAAQAQALGEWIAARAEAQERFVVLGDLNRAGAPDAEDPFWQMLDASRFDAAASHLPFRNCVFGAPYEAFIDHILVDRALLPQLHAEGFAQMRFHAAKSTRYRLPDHCPVRVSLSLAQVV